MHVSGEMDYAPEIGIEARRRTRRTVGREEEEGAMSRAPAACDALGVWVTARPFLPSSLFLPTEEGCGCGARLPLL
jgi:hypothetical protein